MHPLTFDRRSYLAHGEREFLISGEIHYFRVPRDGWRDRLEKMKAAGGNCVATYVPWLIHEPEEGAFDFQTPQYDVEAFLTLCQEVGLWAIVRPGPYQYSELAYDGLPGWLCENYPEMRARDFDGKAFRVSSLSYLHPRFLEKARRWFGAVIPRLARHQVTRGGAVAAVQFDNECVGIHEWFTGSWDYHPDTMGIGHEFGRWPDFVRGKYGTLAAVNAAYGVQASSWAEVRPLKTVTDGSAEQRRRVRDYQACYFASIADYAATLTGWMSEEGIDVPFVHNSGNPEMNAYFRETVARLGAGFLLGSDHYYTLGQGWDQNNPTPQWATKCFVSLEGLRHLGAPPTVFELPGGSLSDFPPVTPHDAACAYLTNIAYGMKGYNYYIFTGGINPPGAGTTGEVYDYGAAVAPDGAMRPLYFVQQALAELLHRQRWLAGAAQVTDCHLGLMWEYSRSKTYGADCASGITFANTDAWAFFRQGLLMSACCAGLSPDTVDLSGQAFLRDLTQPVLVASATSMPREVQTRLVRFLAAGGKLLLAPVVPTLDDEFRPCTILADYLGGVRQEPYPAMAPLLTAFGVRNIYVNGGLMATRQRPAGAVTTAVESRGGEVEIGWRLALPSGGVASVLGVHWSQAKREHEAMLQHAVVDLGAEPCVRCDNPNVWTVLRSDGQQSMLFLLNLLSAPMTAQVRFRDPVTGVWVDTGRHELPGISARAWMDGRSIFP
jgi:beta-galactosidase